MIIHHSLGKFDSHIGPNHKSLHYFNIEWYEASKRILHKKLGNNQEVSVRFLQPDQRLEQDDILWEDECSIILVNIRECECMAVKPLSMFDTARLCYEIGNKHLPLFIDSGEVIVPFDAPLYRWLQGNDFFPAVAQRKLSGQLRTSVQPHGGSSLFSKIMKLTAANE